MGAVFLLEVKLDSTYLYSEFTTLTPGSGFRLFPFGRVHKGGNVYDITPEFAKTIKLPHFAPPIKLGSHEDETPAGGFITSLEVRDDGLYAIPEWNEVGKKAIDSGSFRYNSPEILWQGGLQNPKDGIVIRDPLIVGSALLHMPHLGNDAALYSVEPIDNKEIDMLENVTVPKNLWDKFNAFIDSRITPPEPQKVEVIPDDYEAAKRERDEFKSKIDAIEAEKIRTTRVEKFEAELKETKADPALADLLADLPDEKADGIMKQFRALSEQINASALLGEKGSEGGPIDDPKAAFNALVLKYGAEHKVDYNAAFEIVKTENPELFSAWAVKKEK